MLGPVVRVVTRLSAGVVLGGVPGALYAALVAAVHLGVYGRWDRVPAFAVGCVVVGALFGMSGLLLVGLFCNSLVRRIRSRGLMAQPPMPRAAAR